MSLLRVLILLIVVRRLIRLKISGRLALLLRRLCIRRRRLNVLVIVLRRLRMVVLRCMAWLLRRRMFMVLSGLVRGLWVCRLIWMFGAWLLLSVIMLSLSRLRVLIFKLLRGCRRMLGRRLVCLTLFV